MTIDQISVFVENSPGRLAEVTTLLAENNIDLRAMSIADTADFGVLRVIVNDQERARKVLQDAGCVVSVTSVLAVSLEDKPGGLAKVLRILADAQISIEYIYAFISRKEGNAYVVFRVEDNCGAIAVLEKNGIKTAALSDIVDC
jgi:hypothetical protein